MSFINAGVIAKRTRQDSGWSEDPIQNTFLFILKYFETNKAGPSSQEICLALDTMYEKETSTSRSTVRTYLHELAARGLIELPYGEWRSMGKIIIPNSRWVYEGATGRDLAETTTES